MNRLILATALLGLVGLFGCGDDSGGAVGGGMDSCGFLEEVCPSCDLPANNSGCLAEVARGDAAQCQRAFEDQYSEACFPTSAYCEELRAICDTCTDPNQRNNCITATSSRNAFEDPTLCENFDISAQGSCAQP